MQLEVIGKYRAFNGSRVFVVVFHEIFEKYFQSDIERMNVCCDLLLCSCYRYYN